MRKFFACSVGEPTKGYDEENLRQIIEKKAFILHEDAIQKGVYEEIGNGDIILLKYRKNFVAYGETSGRETTEDEEWNLTAPVIEWHFKDPNDPSVGVRTYGIQWNTFEGAGQMGTVKEIDETFAINKIKEINTSSQLFKNIILEITKRKNMENNENIINLLNHKMQIILQGPPGTGKTYTAKDIAEKIIFGEITSNKKEQKIRLEKTEQFKLIQFHPAYSYEDFVRGITAKPNGEFVEYKSENKTLGIFAAEAHRNYLDSKKDTEILSKEQWLNDMFEDFKDLIQSDLDISGKYGISDSAYIYEIDDSSFRYTGDNWGTKFRMPFSDIFKLYHLNITGRKQIKKHTEIAGRTKQHATYFFNLLQAFRKYLVDKNYNVSQDSKVGEKKYILIIDEINRANLPSVLGELIYALEYRGEKVDSMYEIDEDYSLVLPPNLYIIGTMNTADRSVGHIDYAIRRRFAFVDIEPSFTVITEVVPEENGLRDKALKLFAAVASFFTYEKMASDFKAKDIQLGHSYFLAQTESDLSLKLQFEIKPLLKEYIKDGILISVKNEEGIDLTEQEIDNLKIG